MVCVSPEEIASRAVAAWALPLSLSLLHLRLHEELDEAEEGRETLPLMIAA